MDFGAAAIAGLAGIGLLTWLTNLLFVSLLISKVPRLLAQSLTGAAPRVSVLIPACNEAEAIEPALRAHLTSDHPDIEFVVVNDRSTDRTGEILDRLSAEDTRIVPIHIADLPEGWLGKVHALQVAQERATGEWLLLVDADVQLAPEAVASAVQHCAQEELDLLTCIPRFHGSTAMIEACVVNMVRTIFGTGQIWRAPDPKARQSAGFGAFILLRRSAWRETEGFEWLKLEVADDLAVGMLMKRSGKRCGVAHAPGLVALQWYSRLGEVMRSVEKGGLSIVGRYSLVRTVFMAGLVSVVELAPLAAFVPGLKTPVWLPVLGIASIGLALVCSTRIARWLELPLRGVLLTPLATLMVSVFTIRSGIIGTLRGGLTWRSTTYPLRMLREGMRVNWP